MREAREEISLEVEIRALLGVYSRPERDPRGQTITVVYIARASGTPRGDDDAKNAALCDPRNPPTPLAFDHAEILRRLRAFPRKRRISRTLAPLEMPAREQTGALGKSGDPLLLTISWIVIL